MKIKSISASLYIAETPKIVNKKVIVYPFVNEGNELLYAFIINKTQKIVKNAKQIIPPSISTSK